MEMKLRICQKRGILDNYTANKLIQLADECYYKFTDDLHFAEDTLQDIKLRFFETWMGYNYKKSSSSLGYFTEIAKRRIWETSQLRYHKWDGIFISLDSLYESDEQ